jgi:GTPase KRas protein
LLIGDKEESRKINRSQGIDLAKTFGCQYIETSSLTGQNVDELFLNLATEVAYNKSKSKVII